MILFVSGRTDIVAFYSDWFFNRYKEGFVDVRNPFNYHFVNRIFFDDVDAILFCTKNPKPIIKYLPEIRKPILFHITLTPYKNDIEPNIDKKVVIEDIKELTKYIPIENIYIRYDPILINSKYNISYHVNAFERMCSLLEGYVKHIIISFVDIYKNVLHNMNILELKEFKEEDLEIIGNSFFESARKHNMTVQTCYEENRMLKYGFIKNECLSKELAYSLTGKTNYKRWKARKENKCECVQMCDIGAYNTCKNFCKYCYANFDENKVMHNYDLHDDKSSLLIGYLEKEDIIKIRK